MTRICAHQSLVQQQRYFKKLGAPVPKAAQLRQGLFRGLQASSSTAGARRAGIASGSLGLAPLALIAALALALAGLAARRGLAPRSIP